MSEFNTQPSLQGKFQSIVSECAETVAKCRSDPACRNLLRYWEKDYSASPNLSERPVDFLFRKNKIILNWIKFDPEINIK